MAKRKMKAAKKVEALTHDEASRKNIPTAEYEAVIDPEERSPFQVAFQRRNRDLDPQLVWRGKDEGGWSDLVVQVPPLFIQEKVHPKALIDDVMRASTRDGQSQEEALDLFSDFNGLPSREATTEFYQHDANWSNRMILGDSLQVMASLGEREGLRGKVQTIFIDPPYGIRFNSNFQWSTTSLDVKDGKLEHITREPEQVKAFRDTWKDGIHSYLTYLRDRLTVARELLADSGSLFVQIGAENVHLVRALIEEVFGAANFVAQITFRVKSPLGVSDLARTTDFIIWYAKSKEQMKFRQARVRKELSEHPEFSSVLLPDGTSTSRSKYEGDEKDVRFFTAQNLGSSGYTPSCMYQAAVQGRTFDPPRGKSWKTNEEGMRRLARAGRLHPLRTSLRWRYFFDDAPSEVIKDVWTDTFAASAKTYVVQTATSAIQRCILMTTDPGDLLLDPTCGSGTTAYVAEQWGRRWITIDTSRVALALARARIMGAQYPYYWLADSTEGQLKEAEVIRKPPSTAPTHGDLRHGFVYHRVPHVTLRSIATNLEVDTIWERFQGEIEELRKDLNTVLGQCWEEWDVPGSADPSWPSDGIAAHEAFTALRSERQAEMDAMVQAAADSQNLYDRPYEDPARVRVAGPFTVESLSPYRTLPVDENDELLDPVEAVEETRSGVQNFAAMVLENLRTGGVQQAHKSDKIDFVSLEPWPGDLICADGRYFEGSELSSGQKRAGIFVGPEFGTVGRPDLVQAVGEAVDGGFDILIVCAFSYDAHISDFDRVGRIPILKARMNADLHMADDLKNTGKGNLFVVFGEPDIDLLGDDGDLSTSPTIRVRINGVDVFDPSSGEVRSDGADGIACWFVDTDYNEQSFFVRQAYFLGANDPYKALRSSLRAEVDEEAWETLNSNVSRSFERPESGRIAVKVINHLGDEVMKVFRIE